MNKEHYRKLERMYLKAPTNEYFRPEIRIADGEAEVTLEVRPDFLHTAKGLHGAIYFKMMDDSSFFAVNSLVEDVFVLTVSYNVHLLRPVSEGTIRGRGTVVHQSKRLFVAESEVLDGNGAVIARGSGTFMRSKIPLTPEVDYK